MMESSAPFEWEMGNCDVTALLELSNIRDIISETTKNITKSIKYISRACVEMEQSMEKGIAAYEQAKVGAQ